MNYRTDAWGWDSDSDEDLAFPSRPPPPPRTIIIHPPPSPPPPPPPPFEIPQSIRPRLSFPEGFVGSWCFHLHYTFNKYTDGEFLSNALEMGTSRSAEEFIDIVQRLPKPSEVFCVYEPDKTIGFTMHRSKMVEAFSVFREGVRPTWDDPRNAGGGHYELTGMLSLDNIDYMWEKTLPMIVALGNTNITGARIVDKTRIDLSSILYRLEIWFQSPPPDALTTIPEEIQDLRQGFPFQVASVRWKSHKQEQEKGGKKPVKKPVKRR